MSAPELDHNEYSKRDRILNALTVYPDRYEISNQVVADLVEASRSYVYQLRTAIDEGELSDEEIDLAFDSELQSQYRDRIGELLQEYDVTRTIEEGEEMEDEGGNSEELGSREETISNESVPLTKVDHIRDTMRQYREDADFERKRFQGSERNIAEEKYFIADRAVKLLDQLIQE